MFKAVKSSLVNVISCFLSDVNTDKISSQHLESKGRNLWAEVFAGLQRCSVSIQNQDLSEQ